MGFFSSIGNLFGRAKTFVGNVVNRIGNAASAGKTFLANVSTKISGLLASPIGGVISNLTGITGDSLPNLIQKVSDGGLHGLPAVIHDLKTNAQDAKTNIAGFGRGILDEGRAKVNEISAGLSNILGSIRN